MPEKIKVQRRPLAWGMQQWGPLPGTGGMFLIWDGPGAGIYMHVNDQLPGNRVRHPSASGTYETVKAADAAVQEFVRIGIKSWAKDGQV